jgi:AAA+ ATPase superfamily predicted ATPase
MDRFVDREQELVTLNRLLEQPGAQFLVVYGRRRVGKTTLLLKWAQDSGRPFVYWVASRDTPDRLRWSLARALWRHFRPDRTPPTFEHWEVLFENLADELGDQQLVLILDELPYAAEADPSLTSKLQNAWDHLFKDKNLCLVVAGSQIGMMHRLQSYSAPLFGRFTARLQLKPLPFYALKEFLPRYSLEQRIAVYAILGGIPAYLERFDDSQSIAANVQQEIFDPSGMFGMEPFFLLNEEVREPRNFLAVIRAIAQGRRTLDEIAGFTGLARQNASTYLSRLMDLHYVERAVPATVRPERRTTRGRYKLCDNYLRFYFRFVEPNRDLLETGQVGRVWEQVNDQMRAFVGMTAFEDLCRQWVIEQAIQGKLPFLPDRVGSHWSRDAQVDVVAIRWEQKHILLGEAKWGTDPVGRSVLTDLLGKTPKVVPEGGAGWTVHYALFARAGFTEATQSLAAEQGVRLVDLAELGRGLGAA